MASEYHREALVLPSPRTIQSSYKWVYIYHRFEDCLLLSLPAYFRPPDNQYAVEFKLVMDACRVLTNAAAGDAHLIQKQDQERIPGNTVILAPGSYFYCLDDTNTNYPVVTEFAAWRFPHNSLPLDWQLPKPENVRSNLNQQFLSASVSGMSQIVKNSDQHCLITKYRNMTQNAYIVPKDQIDWFDANEMEQYCVGNPATGINNVANGMTLRSDVRLCLDLHNFVIRPVGHRFKMHMVKGADDYSELLHWRLVEISDRVPTEFLYARFAYTIINCLHPPSAKFLRPVEINERVKRAREARLKQTLTKKRRFSQISESTSGDDDTDPSGSMMQTENFFADLDKRWRDRFAKEHPDLVEESDNPPETRNDRHIETPRMLLLKSAYIRDNPQVWQSSTTPPGSVRPDEEGYRLQIMDIQTKYDT